MANGSSPGLAMRCRSGGSSRMGGKTSRMRPVSRLRSLLWKRSGIGSRLLHRPACWMTPERSYEVTTLYVFALPIGPVMAMFCLSWRISDRFA